jgi:hypothetical protein
LISFFIFWGILYSAKRKVRFGCHPKFLASKPLLLKLNLFCFWISWTCHVSMYMNEKSLYPHLT